MEHLLNFWRFPDLGVTNPWSYPKLAGRFMKNGEAPIKNGWWLGVPLWLRKPPIIYGYHLPDIHKQFYWHIIYILYTYYIHITYILYTYYIHIIYILFTYYIHIIYILYTYYIQYILYTWFIDVHYFNGPCINIYWTMYKYANKPYIDMLHAPQL